MGSGHGKSFARGCHLSQPTNCASFHGEIRIYVYTVLQRCGLRRFMAVDARARQWRVKSWSPGERAYLAQAPGPKRSVPAHSVLDKSIRNWKVESESHPLTLATENRLPKTLLKTCYRFAELCVVFLAIESRQLASGTFFL